MTSEQEEAPVECGDLVSVPLKLTQACQSPGRQASNCHLKWFELPPLSVGCGFLYILVKWVHFSSKIV